MKTKITPLQYLQRAQELGIEPNFFMSEPYLRLSEGLKAYEENDFIFIMDEDWCLFPALHTSMGNHTMMPYPTCIRKVWADFNESDMKGYNFLSQSLDYEYIFNPEHFQWMYGKNWETFRKNIRKWPRNNPNYWYHPLHPNRNANELLIDWLERKINTVEDAELIIRFVREDHPDIHKRYIYAGDKIVGVNIWDENWKYINYRYCIVDPKEPYLDEFARYLFYTDTEVLSKGKLVNDGGTLGNKGLEKFKDKLNPIRKRMVNSWIL